MTVFTIAARRARRGSTALALVATSAITLGAAFIAASPAQAQEACDINGVPGVPSAALSSLECGTTATATGVFSIAIGSSSLAIGEASIAIGAESEASAGQATAVGFGSVADDIQSSAFGALANAAGQFSTALGAEAKATSELATAAGFNSTASGLGSSVFGGLATASGDYSVAIGSLSAASKEGSTAVGNSAWATAENATALGHSSRALHANSVAIGTNTATTAANQVHVGGRTISGVTAGAVDATSTDAVNGAQLFATNANVTAATTAITAIQAVNTTQTTQINTLTTGLATTNTALANETNARLAGDAVLGERLDDLSFDLRRNGRDARAGTSAALAAAALPQAMDSGRSMIAAGVGTYRGRTALAIGGSHRLSGGNAVIKVGITYDTKEHVGANAGVGFQF